MRDLHNSINVKRGLSPVAAVTDNTAFVSQIVDRSGYESCEFVILVGNAGTGATFACLFEDGDAANLSDHAEVAAGNLLGTEALAGFDSTASNKVFKIGYAGTKRYCRVTVTPATNTGNAFVAGAWILGGAHNAPTANPPV